MKPYTRFPIKHQQRDGKKKKDMSFVYILGPTDAKESSIWEVAVTACLKESPFNSSGAIQQSHIKRARLADKHG
jgi:hypothetical protein